MELRINFWMPANVLFFNFAYGWENFSNMLETWPSTGFDFTDFSNTSSFPSSRGGHVWINIKGINYIVENIPHYWHSRRWETNDGWMVDRCSLVPLITWMFVSERLQIKQNLDTEHPAFNFGVFSCSQRSNKAKPRRWAFSL